MTNQFRAHGVATGANVLTPDQWANLGVRQQGFVQGTALSRQVNTPLRQATSWGEALGGFVDDAGFNALDDGNIAQLQENFEAALGAYIGGVIPDSSLWHYGTASGTSSALIVASTVPALKTPYVAGSVVAVRMPSNLAASPGATIKIINGATVPLRRNRGGSLGDGDMPSNSFVPLIYDGSGWRIIGPAYGEIPINEVNPTLYVSPAGSDSTADGSTPQTAFRQPRQAILVGRQRYPLSATTLNITIADGSYEGLGSIPPIAGALNLIGNADNPENVILTGAGVAGQGVSGFGAGTHSVTGLTFQNAGTIAHTIAIGDGSLTLSKCRLISTASNTGNAHLYANPNGSIFVRDGNGSQGAMGYLFWANGGTISIGSISVALPFQLIGSNSFAVAAASSSDNALIRLFPGVTFPGGSAAGVRYRVSDNSLINAFNNGPDAFPGNQAGVTTENGIYKSS